MWRANPPSWRTHVRHRPFCQGTRVRPSWCLPLSLSSPTGSFVAGKSDRLRARQMRSLICWIRVDLPVFILHDMPCVPVALTVRHTDKCSLQRLSPRRNPTATRMVSSHIRRPHDEMGRAQSQSLLWIALGANNLALSRPITQVFQIVAQSHASYERCRAELSSACGVVGGTSTGSGLLDSIVHA